MAIALAVGGPMAARFNYLQKESAKTSEQLAIQARKAAEASEQIAVKAQKAAQSSEQREKVAKDQALKARDKAQRNEKLAREARTVAAKQGRVALDALADMVRKVQAELKNKSGMQPLRELLLNSAMEQTWGRH